MASERRSLITSEPSLSAEEVTHRTFATTFRGFDPAEVRSFLERVAGELRTLRNRVQETERQLREAESRAAHPEIDEATLMTALGEETARVIRSAHEAATDIRGKAEENAERILRDAHEDANRLRGDADRILTVRTEEADAAAASIREAAESWGEAVRNRANEEAQQVIEDARAEGRKMIEEAQAVRAKVLGDLSRRRRIAAVQVEQLRAGRERLLDAYRLVRSTLDEVTDDLQRAEAEARSAASAAATRAEVDIDDVTADEIDEALVAVREAAAQAGGGAAAVPPETSGAASPEVPATDTATPPPSPSPPPRPASSSVRVLEVGESPAPPAVAPPSRPEPPEPPEPAGSDVEPVVAIDAEQAGAANGVTGSDERRLSSLRILRRPKADDPKKAQPPPPLADGGESVRIIRPTKAAPADAAPEARPAPPAAAGPAGGAADAGADAGDAGEAVVAAVAAAVEAPAVDELFARIRADREQAVAEAEQVLAAPPAGDAGDGDEPGAAGAGAEGAADGDAAAAGPDATAASGDGGGGDVVEDADERLLQQRDEAVEAIEQQLARKLKRALQDDQNDLLDRLRKRGKGGYASVLPERDAQTQRFRDVGRALLEQAAAAGVAFVDRPDADATVTVAVTDLADDLATSLAGPLRTRLEQVLRATDDEGEDDATAGERIGMAYREWKAQRIERLAGDQVIAAFTRGTFEALGEATPVRWVVSDLDGPCPDCDDNALAGVTTRGEEFPTGQLHPPAHAGCRCLLAPAPR